MSDRRPPATRFAAAVFLLAAGLIGAAAQPPEQIDPNGGVKKKVTADDGPDPKPVGKPRTAPAKVGVINPPDVRLDEVARLAETAQNPDLKKFYTRFSVPFDLLTDKAGANTRVRPFFRHWGKDEFPRGKAFHVTELDAAGKPAEERTVEVAEVKKLDPFEQVAVAEAEQWLKSRPPSVTTDDAVLAAETVLAAALRFHDYARKTKAEGWELTIRSGKGWDEVRRPLADKLREVRLLPLTEAEEELKKPVPDFDRARVLLDRVEARLPDKGGEAGNRVRQQLSAEAGRLAKEVLKKLKAGSGGATLVKDAALARRLDPDHPDVQELQKEMKGTAGYSVLVVAVRQFPVRMTPATARHDSEKQAVELMYEGLLTEIPGPDGVRYRPAAAVEVPAIQPGGRAVALGTEKWAFPDQGPLDPHDVVGTLRLLRAKPELWVSAGLPWLDDQPTPTPGGVKLGFRMSHPDPRALLTFKVLPARWLAERGKDVIDGEYAEQPWGTGPYRLDVRASRRREGDAGRELVFVANDGYPRPGRTDEPEIREVRFVEVGKLGDLSGEFRFDRLHVLPDVPTADLKVFEDMAGKGGTGKVRVVTAQTNRRVHILSVNNRRAYLQNKDLRRGLSLAIDREAVLNDVYRAGRPEFHRVMSGPFPPRSWAETQATGGRPQSLLNRDLAAGKIRNYLADKTVPDALRLAFAVDERFPEDLKETNPRNYKSPAGRAAAQMKEQVEGLFKDGGGRKLTIQPEPLTAGELFRRVEDEHNFELAYMPFDYPDDWFPLGLAAFLDPTATGRGGRNTTGFLGPDARGDLDDARMAQALAGVLATRDYGEKVPRLLREFHDEFVKGVPFIPLWQLDRHSAFHRNVEVDYGDPEPPPASAEEAEARQLRNLRLLNPTVLFQGVGRWRVK